MAKMSKSDSESSSSSDSDSSASSREEHLSPDKSHDEKHTVGKKNQKARERNGTNSENSENEKGSRSKKKNDGNSVKSRKDISPKRKDRKQKQESSSDSSSSSSSESSSSDSSSDGEITSTDSSSSSSSDSEEEQKERKEPKSGVANELQHDKETTGGNGECLQENGEEKIAPSESNSEKISKKAVSNETADKESGEITPSGGQKEVEMGMEKEYGEIIDEQTDVLAEKANSKSINQERGTNSPHADQQHYNKHHLKSRSRTRSKSADHVNERSKTPRDNKCRRSSRSRSREQQRRKRSRSRSGTRSRSRSRSLSKENQRSERRYKHRRSHSADYERKKFRRSESLERRREERRKRHAERDEEERFKRARREEENVERREKELNKPDGDPDKVKELDNTTVTDPKAKITERQRKTVDLLTSRTGGAYIPPAKLRLMQAEITDKSSAAYQRIAWEALKKSIHGYINKVNVDNIAIITRELLKENIVRGRGLLCRSIIQAQAASPTFTHVYAALVSIINSKFPNIGELLLKRLVIQFKRAFRRNDKAVCLSSSRFIAHLVNQRVAHEILALEILTLLVESPTDDSVEVAIAFLKECGMKLTEVSSKGIGAIFEMLKNILHEGKLDKRVQYMIEVVFQVRKDGFKDHQSVIESLELVEEDDQFTHLLMLDDATNTEDILNAFKFDEEYAANEDKYKGLSKEILGSDASDSDGSSSGSDSGSGSGSSDSDDNEKGEGKPSAEEIIDNTETNLIALRRTIYLTINSSLDYEECAHKLMKMQLKPGQEIELCHMFLDCCAEQRTYEKFYGLLAQRFCSINKIYIEPFEEIFKDTYQTTHRLDTNRLRNVSKFFAHLLFTDAISWDVLECIKLNEDDTTSSSRIFIKILFQELAEYMGLSQLNKKLKDEVLLESLAGIFPKDNPRNTRFSINFFTSIGLGGLTDELRHFLKNAPKSVPAINAEILANKPINVNSSSSTSSSSSSTSSESSSESSETSSSSGSNSDSESDSEEDKRKQRKKKLKKTKKVVSSRKKDKEKSRKKDKAKKLNKKRKKGKESESSSSSESDSKSESDTSSSDESTESSSNSSRNSKRKSKKKDKTKQTAKQSKKPNKNAKESDSSSEEIHEEKVDTNRGRTHQNGDASESIRRNNKRDPLYQENRSDYKNERANKRAEPQRRDSEVERRREEREKRHRDNEKVYKETKKRSRSRSRSRSRDRITRDDRDRRNRDHERDRESDRRRDRKRYDDRKSRSRSQDRCSKVKRERSYAHSKARNTSKERG